MATNNDGVSRYVDSTVYSKVSLLGGVGLPTNGATATAGELGYRLQGFAPELSFSNNITRSMASINLTPGTWIIFAEVDLDSSGAYVTPLSMACFAINDISGNIVNSTTGSVWCRNCVWGDGAIVANLGYGNPEQGQNYATTLATIIQLTASKTAYLNGRVTFASGIATNYNSNIQAVRIA